MVLVRIFRQSCRARRRGRHESVGGIPPCRASYCRGCRSQTACRLSSYSDRRWCCRYRRTSRGRRLHGCWDSFWPRSEHIGHPVRQCTLPVPHLALQESVDADVPHQFGILLTPLLGCHPEHCHIQQICFVSIHVRSLLGGEFYRDQMMFNRTGMNSIIYLRQFTLHTPP